MSTTPPPPDPHSPKGPLRDRSRIVRSARHGLRSLGTDLTTPAHSTAPLLANAPKQWLRLLPYGVAVALVATLIPVTTQVLANDYGVAGGLAGALGVAQSAPLLLAVTRPLPAWWIVIVADTVGGLVLLNTPVEPSRPWPWTAMVIVGYSALCLALALRERRRTVLAVWLVTAAVSLAFGLFAHERSEETSVLLIVLSGAMLLIGTTVRERADARQQLAEQETISEAERAHRTLLEERARIARELHDVVAHHMSVITVQADSAPYRLDGLDTAAREEFDSIASAARESLSEMRRLLGVLRSEEAAGERAPQPGLDRLAQLADATERAGVPTELTVDDGMSGLPQAVQLSVYRIVQEALANVVRHAPGASARVSVTAVASAATDTQAAVASVADSGTPEGAGADSPAQPRAVRVLVENGPSPAPPSTPLEADGTGHGLVGMRERVRLIDGSVDTGALADGGYRVAAEIPLNGKDFPTP